MKERNEKTIAAISTGLTPSGISIVRMSGPDALEIARRVFRGKGDLSGMKSHTIRHGFLEDQGKVVDEVLLSYMKAPHSYTGEDVVEINCHGGVYVTKRALELVLRNGATIASPGEFTKRAFLNGKMDLNMAEAVADVIRSENDLALRSSVSVLRGSLSREVKALRSALLDEIAFLEAAMDDPEHYDPDERKEEISDVLCKTGDAIDRLIASSSQGKLAGEGVRTVISGLPNAGKSSLFNLLSGDDLAIVTEIPGTTRDVLEEKIAFGPVSLILMDTAGLRSTDEPIEKIGVTKAIDAAKNATLLLYVVDAAQGIGEEDRKNLRAASPRDKILILNKCDAISAEERKTLQAEADELGEAVFCFVFFSCREKEGLDDLRDAVQARFGSGALGNGTEEIIANERQIACLRAARESVSEARKALELSVGDEFTAAEMTNAYGSLGEIIGESVGEDVIDRVFEAFCMGK